MESRYGVEQAMAAMSAGLGRAGKRNTLNDDSHSLLRTSAVRVMVSFSSTAFFRPLTGVDLDRAISTSHASHTLS